MIFRGAELCWRCCFGEMVFNSAGFKFRKEAYFLIERTSCLKGANDYGEGIVSIMFSRSKGTF